MSLVSLDIAKTEHGFGASEVKRILGNPNQTPVNRDNTGWGLTPVIIGSTEGYDVSSGNLVRLYWDIVLGNATAFKLYVLPLAADPGPGGRPTLIGNNPQYQPKVVVTQAAAGPFRVVDGPIEITSTDLRGSLTVERPSLAIRFALATDVATPTGEAALAAQLLASKGNE